VDAAAVPVVRKERFVRLIEPTGEPRFSLAAVGDVGIIGPAHARASREGFDAALRVPGETLRTADLAFANLEFPIGEAGSVRPGRTPAFHHDPRVCGALARAGVRVVSLATNHAMDCGRGGLERTLGACREAGLLVAGAGNDLEAARRPALLEARGLRVGVLAYSQTEGDAAGPGTPGVAPLQEGLIREDLARWRPQVDFLVVSAHWGSMYVDYPPPRVTRLARALAECGADLVLGHHPHVLQGAERMGRTLVAYSLGDGVFNSRSGDFRASVGAESRLASGVFTAWLTAGEPGLDFAPYRLDEDGFPSSIPPEEAAAAVARLRALGEGLRDAEGRFAREGTRDLLRYELEALGHYLGQGRVDKALRVLLSVRPRHLPVLWQALRRSAGRR
jgi:hypothetical protein